MIASLPRGTVRTGGRLLGCCVQLPQGQTQRRATLRVGAQQARPYACTPRKRTCILRRKVTETSQRIGRYALSVALDKQAKVDESEIADDGASCSAPIARIRGPGMTAFAQEMGVPVARRPAYDNSLARLR